MLNALKPLKWSSLRSCSAWRVPFKPQCVPSVPLHSQMRSHVPSAATLFPMRQFCSSSANKNNTQTKSSSNDNTTPDLDAKDEDQETTSNRWGLGFWLAAVVCHHPNPYTIMHPSPLHHFIHYPTTSSASHHHTPHHHTTVIITPSLNYHHHTITQASPYAVTPSSSPSHRHGTEIVFSVRLLLVCQGSF